MKRKQAVDKKRYAKHFLDEESLNYYRHNGILPSPTEKVGALGGNYKRMHKSRFWFKFPFEEEFEVFQMTKYCLGYTSTKDFDARISSWYFYGWTVRAEFFDVNVLLEIRKYCGSDISIEEARDKLVKGFEESGYLVKIVGDLGFIDVRQKESV